MNTDFEEMFQESELEWAELNKLIAKREKKDRKIISQFCAANNSADMLHIIELLEKYGNLPQYDCDIVSEFKEKYPKDLTVQLIHAFTDLTDIYSSILESGGEAND